MPTSKSALKRAITSEKARIRNKSRNSELKTTEKKFRAAVAAKDESAPALCQLACSKLDKAAKVGAIHQNKADRKKGQLMALAAQK